MARKKKKTQIQDESPAPAVPAPSDPAPQTQAPPHVAAESPQPEPAAARTDKPWSSKLPDPYPRDGINLGGGESLHFSRSARFYQNRIEYRVPDGAEPVLDGKYAVWLEEHGWKYRPEENLWTKQLSRNTDSDRYARSKSDLAMELEFIDLGNWIRSDRNMPPVMELGEPERQQSR